MAQPVVHAPLPDYNFGGGQRRADQLMTPRPPAIVARAEALRQQVLALRHEGWQVWFRHRADGTVDTILQPEVA